jgi:hypothetical protein
LELGLAAVTGKFMYGGPILSLGHYHHDLAISLLAGSPDCIGSIAASVPQYLNLVLDQIKMIYREAAH